MQNINECTNLHQLHELTAKAIQTILNKLAVVDKHAPNKTI